MTVTIYKHLNDAERILVALQSGFLYHPSEQPPAALSVLWRVQMHINIQRLPASTQAFLIERERHYSKVPALLTAIENESY